MIVRDALNWGIEYLKKNEVSEPEKSVEILLIQCLNQWPKAPFDFTQGRQSPEPKANKAYLISHSENELTKTQEKKYKRWIKRRAKHEPVWYITGNAEFFSLDFFVTKDVLIPRPETELLLEEILREARSKKQEAGSILEVGTGSGCIAISLAKKLSVNIIATDISEKALKVAKKNTKKHNVADKIAFIQADLFKSKASSPELKAKGFDLIIANLPYIPHKDMDSLAFDIHHFEPRVALDGGKEGLEVIEKFLSQVGDYLKPNGIIFMEIGDRQGDKIKSLAKKYLPGSKAEIKKDYGGFERMAIIRNQKS